VRHIACFTFVACVLAGSAPVAQAQEGGAERPSIFNYAWKGLGTGLSVGTAVGYLATGPTYESGEWRTVVTGLGVGALSGLGIGITLNLVDVGASPAIPGYIVLRDTGYGASLGAIAGLIVGALVAINGGELRDLALGSAYGVVIGAGVGALFGGIEAALTDSPGQRAEGRAAPAQVARDGLRIRFSVGAVQDAQRRLVWMPTALGTF